MPKDLSAIKQLGFSLVEVILSTAVFVLLVTALAGVYLYGQESTAMAGNRARAVMLAEEGVEAARNIRDQSFSNLVDGTYGLTTTGNQWNLSGSQDTTDIFTRKITISSIDSKRKSLTSNVTWQQNPQRSGSVDVSTRLINWQSTAPTPASCNDHAVQEGYVSGTCRANTQQCSRNNEVLLSTGNVYCTGGASADTCCALP